MDKRVAIALLLIVVLSVFLRLYTLNWNSLEEPDSYYFLSIASQFKDWHLPAISAFDSMNPQESVGLYAIPLLLKAITSLTLFQAFQASAPLFGILSILLAFCFGKLLLDDDKLGLLFAFMLCCSLPFLGKTTAGAFRGDSFAGFFLLLGLVLLFWARKKPGLQAIALAAGSGIAIAGAMLVWSGGSFAIPIYLTAIFLSSIMALKQPSLRASLTLSCTAIISLMVFTGLFYFHGLISPTTFSYLNPSSSINSFSGQSGGSGIAINELQKPTLLQFIGTYNIQLVSPAAAFLLPYAWLGLLAALGFSLVFLRKELVGKIAKQMDLAVFGTLMIYLLLTMWFTFKYDRYFSLSCIPVAFFFALTVYVLIENEGIKKLQLAPMALSFVVLVLIALAVVYIINVKPADSISPSFLQTISWIKNNTPGNSLFLSYWPDGSVIEGAGMRASISDSVGGSGNDPETTEWFMYNNLTLSIFQHEPDYILVRYININESHGFCLTLTNQNFWNCSLLNDSGKLNLSYLQSKNPDFLRLLEANGNISIGGADLTEVFNNSDSKIFKVD